jgi:murein DD-endopeptidase MepM/ murein hydrolase activator NlpD
MFRLSLLAATAAFLTGCSDASRLGDPFGNPFESSASHIDKSPTGSVPRQRVASNESIVGQPLAPTSAPAAQPTAASPQAAAVTPQPAAARSASSGNWVAEGGTPLVVAEGESAQVLSNRYGVPVDALLRTNGFGNAGQIRPGARVIIPVYSTASWASPPAARTEPRATPAAEPPRTAHEQHSRETLRLVKGPPPAAEKNAHVAKSALAERGKTAKLKDDAVKGEHAKADAPRAQIASVEKAKADKAKIEKSKAEAAKAETAKGAAAKAATAKAEAAKAETAKAERIKAEKQKADDARAAALKKPTTKPQARIEEEQAKPVAPQKNARIEKPEATKPAIDPAPTASLPPEAAKPAEKAADASNPEFRWPARGRVIQNFKSGGNDGINIALPEGTPVKAAEDGVVAYAGSELKGYGNLVLIRHPNGFVSAYANNGSLDVKRGDAVKRGQTIAKSGQSGNVGSPQLHFELRKGATPVDPSNYLAGL